MQVFRIIMAILLVNCSAFQQVALAQQTTHHVVPTQELQAAVAAKFAQRGQNIREVQKLLRHDVAQKQVGRLVDLERIEKALPTLDDETLNKLATESRKINDQLQGGVSTGEWVIIAILAVIATILIIVIAEASG